MSEYTAFHTQFISSMHMQQTWAQCVSLPSSTIQLQSTYNDIKSSLGLFAVQLRKQNNVTANGLSACNPILALFSVSSPEVLRMFSQ